MNRPSEDVDASAIAARLRTAGAMLRFRGESIHRARAYEGAAEVVEARADELARRAAEGTLAELPGIGTSLASTIGDLLRSGRSETLDRIIGDMAPGLLELVGIPGFTPRRIQLFHRELGVEDVEGVRAALATGAAEKIRGISGLVAGRMLAALERGVVRTQGLVLPEALRWADRIASHLRRASPGASVYLAGDARRGVEVVQSLEFVAASEEPERLLSAFERQPAVAKTLERAGRRCRVLLANAASAMLTVEGREGLGTALVLATGAPAHVEQLRRRAFAVGLDLSSLPGVTEAVVYGRLRLPFIPPELREGRGEIEAAAEGDTFEDLIALGDLRGAIHCHTVYSDGKDTIADMAAAAAALGLTYLTVTDHSPAASYAGGLSSERLAEQRKEIESLRAAAPVELIAGAECDILRDGSLDHPDDARAALEIVIASVHTRHKMDRVAMTDRLVRALATPRFKVWGHPLGRLLMRRPPIDCDLDRVLDVASRAPLAIEINGSPWRLDLPPDLIPTARRRGIKFVVSADAHSTSELEYLRYGVIIARRGGLRRRDVLNALPASELREIAAVGR